MILKNKNIFISGGAGVIGNYLVDKLLEQGAHVFVGDLKPCPKKWIGKLIYRQGDLNCITKEEIEKFQPEYFFHLAATFERSIENYEFWEENFHHNIKLSHYLMTLFKDLKSLKKIIFTSSYLIYDKKQYLFRSPQELPVNLNEDMNINPRNLTGMAKLATEVELDFLSKFNSKKYLTISARIYRSYGKGSRDVISRWIRSLIKKETIKVYSKDGIFDYIYAGDVAEGLVNLAINYKKSGMINLGTGQSRSVNDILKVLKNYFPSMKYVETSTKDKYFEASQADMEKFQHEMSWRPKTTLEIAIPEIVRYEKENITNMAYSKSQNILISSVSSKIPLVCSVIDAAKKFDPMVKIYGGDFDKEVIGKYFVDKFWKMPKLNNLSIEKLIKFCRKESIRIIIPTRDGELLYYSDHKKELNKNGISVMISNPRAVKMSLDKLEFYEKLSKKGIPVVPTSLSIDGVETKSYVVKERFGAGSRKIGLNLGYPKAKKHAKFLENPVYQPFIKGVECSVDVYITNDGVVKGIVSRVRDLVIDGEAQITSTFVDIKLETLITRIVQEMKLTGHVIIQVICNKNGDYHVIECNARFGGASTLSVASGLDSFYWFILEANNVDISGYPFVKKKNLRQVRYKKDLIISI